MPLLRLIIVGLGVFTVLVLGGSRADSVAEPGDRERFEALLKKGNFKDAYEGYRSLALDPKTDPKLLGADLKQAMQCLRKLGRIDEIDALYETTIASHPGNWRLLQTVAESYLNDFGNRGFIVAGKFYRDPHTIGEWREAGTRERDRSRALQLFVQGLGRAQSDPDRVAAGAYLLTLAQALMGNWDKSDFWRLQTLTPLDILADYNDAWDDSWFRNQLGAPVESDGTPVYYRVPESFESTRTTVSAGGGHSPRPPKSTPAWPLGHVWNWPVSCSASLGPKRSLMRRSADSSKVVTNRLRAYSLETLQDDETVAWLATGVRRFKLPDEFNPIKIYQKIADDPKNKKDEKALNALAMIFENRRQLDRAAQYLEQSRLLYGNGKDGWKKKHLDQILNVWGEFDPRTSVPTMTQLTGRRATVDFRFRNGRRIHFEAHEILLSKLLRDVKDYIKSDPKQIDGQISDISNIGSRLVALSQQQYLGRAVAQWDLDVEPAPVISTSGSRSRRRLKRPASTCWSRGWKVGTPAGSWSGSTTP